MKQSYFQGEHRDFPFSAQKLSNKTNFWTI